MQNRRRLNREIVVETAVTMANEAGGYEAVTLVALAKKLSVRMPSLYSHINSLDDLRQAMAVCGLREVVQRLRTAALGLVGEAALRAMAGAYRQFAREQPGVYPLAVAAPEADDPALIVWAQELSQTLLLVLASFGLAGDAAFHAMRGYRAALHGFVALEAAGGFRLPLDKEESFNNLLDVYLTGLAVRQKETDRRDDQ